LVICKSTVILPRADHETGPLPHRGWTPKNYGLNNFPSFRRWS